jgi:hypothetical protein
MHPQFSQTALPVEPVKQKMPETSSIRLIQEIDDFSSCSFTTKGRTFRVEDSA